MLNPQKLIITSLLFRIFCFGKMAAIRSSLLRWAGAKVGENVVIMPSVKFRGNFNLIIGDHCFIGHEAMFMGSANSVIEMENYSKVGSRVIVVTGSHRFSTDGDCIEKEGTYKNIKICKGAAVSTASIVLPGIVVEQMSHAAAGSVITKNIPAFHRVGGSPARIIRDMRVEK